MQEKPEMIAASDDETRAQGVAERMAEDHQENPADLEEEEDQEEDQEYKKGVASDRRVHQSSAAVPYCQYRIESSSHTATRPQNG